MTASEYEEIKRVADALVFDVSAYARSVLLRTVRDLDVSAKDSPSAQEKRGTRAP